MDRDALMNSLPANDPFLAFEQWKKMETEALAYVAGMPEFIG